MKILGIDPGIGRLGWGVIEKNAQRLRVIQFGVIETPKASDRGSRLLTIHRQLRSILKQFEPDLIAVEELFFNKNVTTAMAVAEARGVALLVAAEAGVLAVAFSPASVKSALGFGRASKKQVDHMVKMLLGLQEKFAFDDVSDALAVAICAAQQIKK